MVPSLSWAYVCREPDSDVRASKKHSDTESGGTSLLSASLWFVHQAAAYAFLKLCSQLPWDRVPCDLAEGHSSGDESAPRAVLGGGAQGKQW